MTLRAKHHDHLIVSRRSLAVFGSRVDIHLVRIRRLFGYL